MSILTRLFGKARAEREALRPLWQRVIEIAREKRWYAECGIADTIAGRFDTITLVLSLVLLRMEKEEALIEPSARLTEFFVEDMDGQLRQTGVGDPSVGKHMGRLVSVLGGRLGAIREALRGGEAALAPVLERNVTLTESADASVLATAVLALDRQIDSASAEDLLVGRFAP